MHEVHQESFSSNLAEGEVISVIETVVHNSGDFYGTEKDDITIRRDIVFDSFEKANAWINSMPCSNYEGYLCKYYEYPTDATRSDKRVIEANAKVNELYREFEDYKFANSFMATHNHEFVTCPNCHSKIHRESSMRYGYCDKNTCPVCRKDMRSQTELKRIKAKEDKLEKARIAAREVTMKVAKEKATPEIRWLASYSYHS